MSDSKTIVRTAVILVLLTLAAIAIHGYHFGIEDQEVYLAALNKNLNPSLYPVNSIFFTAQMKASLFIQTVAASIRLTSIPIPWALFLWHVASIFLVLLGCWRVAAACFESDRARWSSVIAVTVLLTIPIAGTALYLVDQYLHPRALATGAILMALAGVLKKRWVSPVLWLIFALLMHPLMALFGISLAVFLAVPGRGRMPFMTGPSRIPQSVANVGASLLLPLGLLEKPSSAWREATLSRSYYFPLKWQWYEWLGVIGPVLLLWWFRSIARKHGFKVTEFLSVRLLAFAAFQFIVAALMTMLPATQRFASLQPMRWLHIFYFVFLIIAGGLAGELLLEAHTWRWIAVYFPLAAIMLYVQLQLFPDSAHVDWPSSSPKNEWVNSFVWIRDNTPIDAVFAIPPKYMGLQGEDAYGFRALAQRSLLAENQKDPGEATVFPELAPQWQEQVHAQLGIEKFSREQFSELKRRYGATWVVLPASANAPLECPFKNARAQVCKIG